MTRFEPRPVPRQTAYRIVCPTCSAFAQLRIADPFGQVQVEPVVVLFSCPNQLSEEHKRPLDDDLLMLVPSDVPEHRRRHDS
jgi:hypothetical protein